MGFFIGSKNLFGGNALADKLVEVAKATKDETAGTVTFTAPNASAKVLYTNFKENTQYTFIVYGQHSSGNTTTNLRIQYTDNSATILSFKSDAPYFIYTSHNGKTIKEFEGRNSSGKTTLYYEQCGIFEGVVTLDDFEPYIGKTVTFPTPNGLPGIPLGTTIPDVIKNSPIHMNGVYWDNEKGQYYIADTKNENGKDVQRITERVFYGTESWTYLNSSNDYIRCGLGGGNRIVDSHLICTHSMYANIDSTTDAVGACMMYSSSANATFFAIRPEAVETYTKDSWIAFVAEQYANGTPITVKYILKEPIETPLSDEEINALNELSGYYVPNVYGKCEQFTTTGKNLLNVPEINSFTSSYRTEDLFIPSGSYIISCGNITTDGNRQPSLYFYNADGTNIGNVDLTSNTNKTFKLNDDAVRIIIYANLNSSESVDVNVTIKQLMVSTNGGEYEPFTGGMASPNTKYPQDIVSVGDSGSIDITSNLVECKLFLGDEDIAKVYLGDELVYSAGNIVIYHVDENAVYTEEVDSGASCLNPTTFTPTKTGWTFVGWREDTTASGDVLSSKIMWDDPIVLYAVYSQSITLKYEGNGHTSGSVSNESKDRYYNAFGDEFNPSFTLKENGYTKTNYVFNGWNLGAVGEVVTLSENTTAYAQWLRYSNPMYWYNGSSYGSGYPSDWTIVETDVNCDHEEDCEIYYRTPINNLYANHHEPWSLSAKATGKTGGNQYIEIVISGMAYGSLSVNGKTITTAGTHKIDITNISDITIYANLGGNEYAVGNIAINSIKFY